MQKWQRQIQLKKGSCGNDKALTYEKVALLANRGESAKRELVAVNFND